MALEPKDPLSTLNSRLSRTAIITGQIAYPAATRTPTFRATPELIVAKTLLTPDMPYWLLTYAAKNPVFPHDSTGDQWFDAGQFSAYTELGRQLGKSIQRLRDQSQDTQQDKALVVAMTDVSVTTATVDEPPSYIQRPSRLALIIRRRNKR